MIIRNSIFQLIEEMVCLISKLAVYCCRFKETTIDSSSAEEKYMDGFASKLVLSHVDDIKYTF